MIFAQQSKFLVVTAPISVGAAPVTTVVIDTLSFDYAIFVAMVGVIDSNATELLIEECDTSGGVYTTVTNLEAGTSTAIDGSTSELPLATGGDGFSWLFDVNLAYRKRYLNVSMTCGGTTLVSIGCFLTRSEDGISSTTDRGNAATPGVKDVLRA